MQLSRSSEETQNIGKQLGSLLKPGHTILLNGELGAGKTCLTQGVLWGIGGTEYARSPTFVMVAQYIGRLTLNHVDLYRLNSPEELPDLGLDEYLHSDGVTVVEWAEKAPGLSKRDHLAVQMQHVSCTERQLTLSANTPEYVNILKALRVHLPENKQSI